MKKFGVLIKDLSFSQLNYSIIKELNTIAKTDYPVLFYEAPNYIFEPIKFPIMNIAEGYEFDGIMVATTLSTALKLQTFPGAKKKYFYINNLEWIHITQKHYTAMKNIYCDTALDIIVRSKEHGDMFKECWNRQPMAILPNFEISTIV